MGEIRSRHLVLSLLAVAATVPAWRSEGRQAPGADPGRAEHGFVEDHGQSPGDVRFLWRGSDGSALLTRTGVVLTSGEDKVRIEFDGGTNRPPAIEGLDPLPDGVDARFPPDGRSFARVWYREVIVGVDLLFRESQTGDLEYDLNLAAGADLAALHLSIQGADSVQVDAGGNVIIHAGCGDFIHWAPVLTTPNGAATSASAQYRLMGPDEIGLVLASTEPGQELVIDPVISYSTYLGGSSSEGTGSTAVDSAGGVYFTGDTFSQDFPTAGPMPSSKSPGTDVLVSKIDASGAFLDYSILLGGSWGETGRAIAVDSSGAACVTGWTGSLEFPTVNAFQPTKPRAQLKLDAFVTRVAPDGSRLEFSTFLGGTDFPGQTQGGSGAASDPLGNCYVVGYTPTSNFPTRNAFQPLFAGGVEDAFATKWSRAGELLASTYLGGSGIDNASGVAVDDTGSFTVVGHTDSTDFPTRVPLYPASAGGYDVFATKFMPAGDVLAYSTYVGGSGADGATSVVVGAGGEAHLIGGTDSVDFPLRNAMQPRFAGGTSDGFVLALEPDGRSLIYSSYLGGSGLEEVWGGALDSSDNLWVAGNTDSTDFPLRCPLQGALEAPADLFLAAIDPSGAWLVQGSYLGGNADERRATVAVDGAGYLYLTANSESTNFPLLNSLQPALAGANDIVVVKLDISDPLPGPVGNTLSAVRVIATGEVRFQWIDVPPSVDYRLHQDTIASGPLDGIAGTATSGLTGILLPMPPEPLLFYRIAGASCNGEGPR